MPGLSSKHKNSADAARRAFPFAAIVGQEEMKLALLLGVIAPALGGVLVMGHRGTGKSTAVRALADLLPAQRAARGCAFGCDPLAAQELCEGCREILAREGKLPSAKRGVPVVDLPLGATEDRVCGTLDVGRALREGVRDFEPGLLARANRGLLYIDEVNLLEDHLVDLLLDVAASGRNRVEREGVSAEHPARFALVGSGNPEEGELRPQLLDRFGLSVEVETELDLDRRVLVVERREAFERDPARFVEAFEAEQSKLRRRLLRATREQSKVEVPRTLLRSIAELCLKLKVDGHRGEITITRAARALAAFEGRRVACAEDARRVAAMSLRHRLRRDPFEQTGGGSRVEELAEELFGEGPAKKDKAGGTSFVGGDFTPDSNGRGGGRARGERETTARVSADPEGERPGDGGPSKEEILPPVEASLRAGELEANGGPRGERSEAGFVARGRGGARRTAVSKRGRYAGATPSEDGARRLAVDATLRAAAARGQTQLKSKLSDAFEVAAPDLRFKRFRAKQGTLYVFAVDASGSMALNRIGQAKGALAQLLRRSYVSRDRVALVSFRGEGAQTLLRPSSSPALARRILDALPVGGPTPLAAGLLRALEVARRASASAARVRLVLFTDGRANVPLAQAGKGNARASRQQVEAEIVKLAASLRAAGVASLVVDTSGPFTSDGGARRLAEALGGRHVKLPAGAEGKNFPGVAEKIR